MKAKITAGKGKIEGCAKVPDELIVKCGICPECGRQLPDPVFEGSEQVTYCQCGAIFTGGR
jgi:transposase